MAMVFIPALLRSFCGGRSSLNVEGTTVHEVIASLEKECPGIAGRLLEGDRLKSNIQVAVDGAVSNRGLRETVGPESEVHFVSAISGGRCDRV